MAPAEDKKNWEGIMVDGKSLEDYFKQEYEQEAATATEEEFKKQKQKKKLIYKKPKYTSSTPERRAGKMTILDQAQINREYLEKHIDNTDSLKGAIICHLIGGKVFTVNDILPQLRRHHDKKQIQNCMAKMVKTAFGAFIETQKVVADGSSLHQYRCTEEGTKLKLNQAIKYSRDLPSYQQPSDPEAQGVPDWAKIVKKILKDELEEFRKQISHLYECLHDLELKPSDAETINIVVSGSLDINFGLKLK